MALSFRAEGRARRLEALLRHHAQGALAPIGHFHRRPMILGHALLAAKLAQNFRRYRARGADTMDAVKAYYKSIWDLFYLEYLLYVFI